jgi:hypothetical protein
LEHIFFAVSGVNGLNFNFFFVVEPSMMGGITLGFYCHILNLVYFIYGTFLGNTKVFI